MLNVAVNANVDEEKETFVKTVEKTEVETQKVEDLSQDNTPLPVSRHPETEMASVSVQTTGSSIPYESVATLSLKLAVI